MRFSDDTRSCAPFTFRIAPLPAVPGEFAAIVAALETRVAAQAAAMGTTVPALQQARVDTLKPQLLPIVIALSMIDPTCKIVSDVGSISGIVGMVPHPGTRLAAAAAGLLTFATQAVREGTANLLPSQLTLMQLTRTPALFREDEEGRGS